MNTSSIQGKQKLIGDVNRAFRNKFFPRGSAASIQLVQNVVFKLQPNGRWVAEQGTVWDFADRFVDEFPSAQESLRKMSVTRRAAVLDIVSTIVTCSPRDVDDIVCQLAARGVVRLPDE